MFVRKLALTAVAGAALLSSAAFAADTKHVVIGTGGQTGVYYQVGGAICRLVNKGSSDHDINCTHKTGGSVANINGMRSGDLDMGVAQSDWQYHGYNGTAPDTFPDGAYQELRAVFSVHPEPFTVVARSDSGIKTFEDLKGKKVNVGDPGSGARATMEVVMEKMGWAMDDFSFAGELKSSEQAAALCDGKVDAIVFTVGHPSGTIKEATTSCESKLINVDNDVIQKLAADNAYYDMTSIKGGTYTGTDEDITTFGVGATFISSTAVDEEVVYQMVKAVFDDFGRFKKMHPAFEHLEEKDMIVKNLSAPLHEGAIRYYKERGWM
ncbi:TAXI family TRAP transporter solute-binding subunit [Kiloniella laminariae]|uniref:TAXI family TRAP transporter solute-binding subunit n=1 Tax=Kiloniella laminariae TaxID=454162 RepID=A0ABT4LME0_9PROT|nr:TAXI family TRAP transporter solute-binding subunit [Kiloniella laminariae]MCZ4282295.1 TAXI family TRAP transporter solute-binding subunit [Kiloniella laminariae]